MTINYTEKIISALIKTVNTFKERGYFRIKALLIALAIGISMSALLVNMLLENVELISLDYRFKARPEQKGSGDIVFIDMAEDSLHQIGRWPWSREWHARLISILSKYKAKMVGFDVLFSEKGSVEPDRLLAEAIKGAGSVYLPYIFEAVPEEGMIISECLPMFTESARGTGYINIFPDPDGVVREVAPLYEFKGKPYPHFALKMACDYLGVRQEDVVLHPRKYIELRSGREARKIPVDKKNRMIINWAGKWEGDSFKHYSYIDILISNEQVLKGQKPRIDLTELKDKVCLIGLTATGLVDVKPTPLQPLCPGVSVHANVITDIVKDDFIHKVDDPVNIYIIMAICLIIGLAIPAIKPVTGFALTSALLAIYVYISFALFITKNIWINTVYTALAIILSYVGITLYTQITEAAEKARLFNLATLDGLTGLCVIRHFNLLMDAHIKQSRELKTPLSVIMSDIDHFKQFNDTYGHQTGDFVLREAAKIFKATARHLDIVARYGGEEFIVLLPNTPLEGAKLAAERIRKTIESTVFKDDDNRKHKVTISLGAAALNKETTKEELIKKADAALYMAKESGRNRVCAL